MFTNQAFQMMLESTPIGYAYHELIYDKHGIPIDYSILNFNPAYLKIIGINGLEVRNKYIFELLPNLKEEIPQLFEAVANAVLNNKHTEISGYVPSFKKWLTIHFFSPHENFFIAQLIDITKEKELELSITQKSKELENLSYHDKLTGLYNRAFFEEELKRLDNDRNLPLSLIMGDVNGLKIINDVFGHLAGDKMLKSIAEILTKSCRNGDIISRWGGDEFVILLPNTSHDIAEEIINRINFNCKDMELDLEYANISLGYAVKDSSNMDIMKVLVNAENSMYKNKLIDGKKVRDVIISSMIQYLFDRDYEIKHHINRVKKYSIELSKELDLSSDDINRLILLAEIHDIGKISIPKEILDKPGELNELEWIEIKKHPETGYRIAKSVPELSDIADLILHHHEFWNGKGYPHGLNGEEIPLLNRIFSIVDVFDAITQDKPHRKAMSFDTAIDFLIENKGIQFDPKIVDIFIKLLLHD